MQNYMPYILFLVGFILIIKGSDWFIDSIIWIAKVLKVPNIIIGATLVSLCTTLPETMVSSSSALKGNSEIAFGNAIGSIIVNTGFILALTIMLVKPKIQDREKLKKTGVFLIFVMLLLFVFSAIFGVISRITGLLFLAILVLYLWQNVKDAKMSQRELREDERMDKSFKTTIKVLLILLIGLIMTIYGANLLVVNGEKIAKMLGVPDVIIGLTLTALGTSLPELVTSITAIVKKVHDISIGNVLGANILNVILVLGLSSSILPIKIQTSYLFLHIPFAFAIVSFVVLLCFINKKHFHRWNGIVLMVMYAFYLYLILFN